MANDLKQLNEAYRGIEEAVDSAKEIRIYNGRVTFIEYEGSHKKAIDSAPIPASGSNLLAWVNSWLLDGEIHPNVHYSKATTPAERRAILNRS